MSQRVERARQPLVLPSWVVAEIDERRGDQTRDEFVAQFLWQPVTVVPAPSLDEQLTFEPLQARDVLLATVMSRLGFRPLNCEGTPEGAAPVGRRPHRRWLDPGRRVAVVTGCAAPPQPCEPGHHVSGPWCSRCRCWFVDGRWQAKHARPS